MCNYYMSPRSDSGSNGSFADIKVEDISIDSIHLGLVSICIRHMLLFISIEFLGIPFHKVAYEVVHK
jgi:hypothetical protein